MQVDFTTLSKILPFIIRARNPILLRAKHGLGKSEFVKAFDSVIGSYLYPDPTERAKAYGDKDYVYPVIDRRASQMPDAGDMMGLPYIDGETTAFRSMKWFHRACAEPVILLFDEIDRGPVEVRQAIFQVNDSRKLGDATLHKDTIVFGCINGGSGDTGMYQVADMDPAELNRWTVFDIKPSVNDWLDYVKDKVHMHVFDFIKQNPSWLEHDKEFEPNKVYPSRRSWVRFSNAVSEDLLNDCVDNKEKAMILFHLVDGYLGNEAAAAFQDFAKNYSKQVTVEDIIVKGDFKIAKTLETNQHMAIIEKFEDHEIFSKPMFYEDDKGEIIKNHNTMNNLAQYIFIVPHELAMKIWEQVTRLYFKNGIALHGTVLGKDKSVSDYLAKLNGSLD